MHWEYNPAWCWAIVPMTIESAQHWQELLSTLQDRSHVKDNIILRLPQLFNSIWWISYKFSAINEKSPYIHLSNLCIFILGYPSHKDNCDHCQCSNREDSLVGSILVTPFSNSKQAYSRWNGKLRETGKKCLDINNLSFSSQMFYGWTELEI